VLHKFASTVKAGGASEESSTVEKYHHGQIGRRVDLDSGRGNFFRDENLIFLYVRGVDLEIKAVLSALLFGPAERHALDHTLPGVDLTSGRSDLRTPVSEAGGRVQYARPGLHWLWSLVDKFDFYTEF